MKLKLLALLYAIGAILTFGHATNHAPPTGGNKAEAQFAAPFYGILCAVAWPLYLSYKVFELKEDK